MKKTFTILLSLSISAQNLLSFKGNNCGLFMAKNIHNGVKKPNQKHMAKGKKNIAPKIKAFVKPSVAPQGSKNKSNTDNTCFALLQVMSIVSVAEAAMKLPVKPIVESILAPIAECQEYCIEKIQDCGEYCMKKIQDGGEYCMEKILDGGEYCLEKAQKVTPNVLGIVKNNGIDIDIDENNGNSILKPAIDINWKKFINSKITVENIKKLLLSIKKLYSKEIQKQLSILDDVEKFMQYKQKDSYTWGDITVKILEIAGNEIFKATAPAIMSTAASVFSSVSQNPAVFIPLMAASYCLWQKI